MFPTRKLIKIFIFVCVCASARVVFYRSGCPDHKSVKRKTLINKYFGLNHITRLKAHHDVCRDIIMQPSLCLSTDMSASLAAKRDKIQREVEELERSLSVTNAELELLSSGTGTHLLSLSVFIALSVCLSLNNLLYLWLDDDCDREDVDTPAGQVDLTVKLCMNWMRVPTKTQNLCVCFLAFSLQQVCWLRERKSRKRSRTWRKCWDHTVPSLFQVPLSGCPAACLWSLNLFIYFHIIRN